MDRTKVAIGAGAIIALAILFAIIFFVYIGQQETSANESQNYKATHTYTYNVGETVHLSSKEDDEGKNYGWYAGFDWEGTLEISVDRVTAYRDQSGSNDFSGLVDLSGMKEIADYPDPAAFVKADLRIKNIDAIPRSDFFNVSVFVLSESVTGDIPLVDLGEAALENPTEKDAYKYCLNVGEEAVITMGWFVDESALANDLHLIIGATGSEKYSFKVSPNYIEEG